MFQFEIKIPDGRPIQFPQDSTFENFISQFQVYCPKILCIINNVHLQYYDKNGVIPTNIRYDYKQKRNGLTEYYFRDIDNNNLYCVFGRESAIIFYPRIDEFDPLNRKRSEIITTINDDKIIKDTNTLSRKPLLQAINPKKESNLYPNNIIIVDKGKRMQFPNPNYSVEIKTHQI